MKPAAWIARHAQTLVGSLGRIAHHPLGPLLTMAVIGVALALPLLLGVLLQNTRAATSTWNQGFELSVYVEKKAAASRASQLAEQLRRRPDVESVRIIAADEALVQFRTESGFGSALDALTQNPLPDTLVVTPTADARSPEAMSTLREAIVKSADVDAVQVDTAWVARLMGILQILHRVMWLIGALLGVGVILVIGNTIRLDILNRRDEIEVMKLVGATDGFTRRPFLYAGVWYGTGGGMVALAVVGLAVGLLARPVDHLAHLYGSPFHFRGLGFEAGMAVLACSIGLGWLGSWLAATQHIRGVEPT